MLDSLQNGYKACIIGASGAIGSAFVAALEADPRCARVIGLHRHSEPAIDFADEADVAAAARALAEQGPFDLIEGRDTTPPAPRQICLPDRMMEASAVSSQRFAALAGNLKPECS